MASYYFLGQELRFTGTFTVSSTPADPTTITLTIKTPGGVTTSYTYALAELTKASTGVYYKDIGLDEEGVWFYRWVGTGTCAAATEGKVFVQSDL